MNLVSKDMVKLESVSKQYGKVTALHETELRVPKGEFLTLLGPSGSGKTTLLNAIAGMATPTSGKVWINSRDVTNLPPEKRGIGMVFQSYALMPHLTVFDNIAYPLRVRKVDKKEIQRRVTEVLEMVRLPDLALRRPKELSGGQQQRVSIARCLVYNPSLILMDEPLGALDKKLREQMQLEIKRLHVELGITMIYVTHDQEEALNMSDRIMLMNGGRIEQVGTPYELYFHPASQFAADFIGQSTMLVGEIVEADKMCVLDLGPNGKCKVHVPNGKVGQKGKLVLRPEVLKLAKSQRCEGDHNFLTCEYKDSLVTGSTIKHFVELVDGEIVTVQELTTPEASAKTVRGIEGISWPVSAGIFLQV